MSIFQNRAFKRGAEWAERRRELKIQGALNTKHRAVKEAIILGQLKSRAGGIAVPDQNVADLMRDWLLITEAMEDGK